jgi:hypothetical protein
MKAPGAPDVATAPTDATADTTVVVRRGRGKPLSNGERIRMLQALLSHSAAGKLHRGAIAAVAVEFGVSRHCVGALWKRGQENGGEYLDVSHRKSLSGRKKIDYSEKISNMKTVPYRERRTLAATSHAVDIPKTTLWERKKEGAVRVHSSTTKPVLTDANKAHRVEFCMAHIGLLNHRYTFHDMLDTVHIDEKWFYVSQPTVKAYLAPDEEEPHRAAKSKQFITKVMFLCAVARPRWDTRANRYFDGKLGIWPFVEKVPAQRASRNRARGTLITKSISVTKEVYKTFIMEKVLPAIEEKWPQCHRDMTIKLQQDNAKPHRIHNDPELLEHMSTMTVKVELVDQPPNSPDLNVLDLGYFSAIQALQQRQQQRTVDDLIAVVDKSYQHLAPVTLAKIFVTLQKVMELVILNDGSNNFKLPHLGKDRLLNRGMVLDTLPVCEELVEKLEATANQVPMAPAAPAAAPVAPGAVDI